MLINHYTNDTLQFHCRSTSSLIISQGIKFLPYIPTERQKKIQIKMMNEQ